MTDYEGFIFHISYQIDKAYKDWTGKKDLPVKIHMKHEYIAEKIMYHLEENLEQYFDVTKGRK